MDLTKRLKGYQKSYRNRHLLALEHGLTDIEYRVWDLFNALYVWDKKYQDSYGKVLATDRDIAKILNCSATKVCRAKQKLVKVRFLEKTGRSEYRVLQNAEMQEENARAKQTLASMKQTSAPVQQNQPQEVDIRLVSSKGNSTLLRSNEEYESLHEEFPTLEIDDLKWIDNNIKGYNN